jgi:tetratricopeptide (TPR) repeat protein
MQMTMAPESESYAVPQVARLFGIPERRLRYWSQTGFIRPSIRKGTRTFYSFRDLIAVKVAKALLDDGVPLRRVRRSLLALERDLRERVGWSRLRIRGEGDRIVVDGGDCSFEAGTGQLVLDFEIEAFQAEAAQVLALPWVSTARDGFGPQTAYGWFVRACELEREWAGAPADRMGFEAARDAYERALQLDGDLAAAWTNLGSMLAEIGEFEPAREHFAQALRCEPDQPEAHCNLAELALAEGEVELAITTYRQVLRAVPDWAEAHYGLARALLEVGGKAQALAHLERFCSAVEATPAAERAPESDVRRDCAQEAIARLRGELSSHR